MGELVAQLKTRASRGGRFAHDWPSIRAWSSVEIETPTGRAAVASDSASTLARGDGFAAGWSRLSAWREGEGLTELRAARPASLVVASGEGLDIERGPYGGRPLFYRQDAEGVVVSSRLGTLVAALRQPPALDVDRVGALGVTRIGPDPRATVYEGVRRLLPCECIRFGPDGSARASFRLPKAPRRLGGSAPEHARALRECLEATVARELRPFTAAAVLTGGGLDSAGVFAVVAHHAAFRKGLRCTALAMDFGGPGDDRPHLHALLRHLGRDGDVLRVCPAEVPPIPFAFFEQDGAPYTWPTCPIGELLGKRARGWGADAVVSGFGGDYVLDGDLGLFAAKARGGPWRAVFEAARLQVPWASSPYENVRDLVVKPLLREVVPSGLLARRHGRRRASLEVSKWAGPRLRRLLVEPLGVESHGDDWQTAFATSPLMMEGADGVAQTEAVWGLPYITPYLDPTFIELVTSFPPEELFLGGQMRGLYRASMGGLLPESLRLRSDKASFEPMLDEMVTALGGEPAFKALLTMEATADLGLLEPAAFRETFSRVARRTPTSRGWLEVWPMLAVEAFLRGRASGHGEPLSGFGGGFVGKA